MSERFHYRKNLKTENTKLATFSGEVMFLKKNLQKHYCLKERVFLTWNHPSRCTESAVYTDRHGTP